MEDQAEQVVTALVSIRRRLSFLSILAVVLCVMGGLAFAMNMRNIRWSISRAQEYDTWARKADLLRQDSRYDELVDFCELRISYAPKDPVAYWNLGIAHFYLENWQDSVDAFVQAAEFMPSWEENAGPFIEKAMAKLDALPKVDFQPIE